MLIAQITDLHLGFDPDNADEFNRKRLDMVLSALNSARPAMDLLVVSGDLADRGDDDSYRRLREILDSCSCPVLCCMGNHDNRSAFLHHFPDYSLADNFLQYVHDTPDLRFIVLDTLENGRHGGGFCEIRAQWLRNMLARQPDKPTLLIMHHPPVETGIAWMNTDPLEPWVGRLAGCLKDQQQIIGIICGHIHRPVSSNWLHMPLAICPSTAPQVALNLESIDPEKPDHRKMIIADPPGYALHWWNGRELISHFETAVNHIKLAEYDETMQPLVRKLLSERPG